MADVELTYKGNTIGSLSDSGSLTLETAGKYCEADIGLSYTSPGGGGESGSFIAATGSFENLTIPVSAQYSHLHIYQKTVPTDASLSGNPYGAYVVLEIFADATINSLLVCGTNYNGTGRGGDYLFRNSSGSGTGNVIFSADSISLKNMRYSGGTRQYLIGETYYWEAW